MFIGVPKEVKTLEFRVGLTPTGVAELVQQNHRVLIESKAGKACSFSDQQYREAGAEIVDTAAEIFHRAEFIVKVKEPQASECKMLQKDQTLFAYLHLAPDPEQTRLLIESNATCIAYETVTDEVGSLPLLTPMSEVAGRMAAQAGAHCLEKAQGGAGILMGGVPGIAPARVLIIGGGVVGINAARSAMGMGARVTIADRSIKRLQELDRLYGDKLNTLYSTKESITQLLPETDLVIGAVLIPGAAAPKLISRDMLKKMRPGSVLVDVAIDQGGCFETSMPTTHANPCYEIDGIVHYCVANMPGGVPRTSTMALTNATLPYVLKLAKQGPVRAMLDDEHLLNGLNIHQGMVTNEAVAKTLGYNFIEPAEALLSSEIRIAS
ncbi:MAG: alanine dehydrogenase [Gammaproteobacteria bacterium]|nr:alanine dehydrogenase [Gammaproteobacteria bacterium]MDD9895305.1 alanine dehydrogenase [Gammaproteobacteria bacterium]MDD9959104.1 alanine dehydrogenase [Gammaproteobacteria bacterium]